jgi:hypothetical protein
MNPAIIALLPLIQSAILQSPDAIAAGMKVAALIRAMFDAGMINAVEQNRLHGFVSDLCRAALTGQRPPELVVDPDPE